MNDKFATYGINELLVKNVDRIVHLEHTEQCLRKVSLKMNLFSRFQT